MSEIQNVYSNSSSPDQSPSSSISAPEQRLVKMEESWRKRLAPEFEKDYMKKLSDFLRTQKKLGKVIYPPAPQIFRAFDATPFEQVKVVIIGQDPYHGPGQAHGLCFSVGQGVAFPPSLQNIFKELNNDLKLPLPKSGDLSPWTQQGVLLLNSVLTVENGKAAAHQGRGWEQFTDQVIHLVNEGRESVAFLLWGSYAQKKAAYVDRKRHLVIESPHPSPLSAHRGFFGSKPFSRINQFLKKTGQSEIDWSLLTH